MNYWGNRSAGFVCGMLALLLLAGVAGCAGSGERPGFAAGPPNVPDQFMHGYHSTTWRELPDMQAGSEFEFSADRPVKAKPTIETLPAPTPVKRKPSPPVQRESSSPPLKRKPLPPEPTRTGSLWRKIARGAATKTDETKTDKASRPLRKVARAAPTETGDTKRSQPVKAESRSRQPAHPTTDIAKSAAAIGGPNRKLIAAPRTGPPWRPVQAIATTAPKTQIVQVGAALTPVTTKRPADLVRSASAARVARVTPLSHPPAVLPKHKASRTTKGSQEPPRKQPAPRAAIPPKILSSLWRPKPTRTSSTPAALAPPPPEAFARRAVRVGPSLVSAGPPAGKEMVRANPQAVPAAPRKKAIKPATTVRLVTASARPTADRPAALQSTVAEEAAAEADDRSSPVGAAPSIIVPSNAPLQLPLRVVAAPASEICVVRLSQGVRQAAAKASTETPSLIAAPFAVLKPQLKDENSRPSTIVLGRPKAQSAAPVAAVFINSNGAAAPGVSSNGSSIRLTVPKRQPNRRPSSWTGRVWGN